MKAYKQKTGQGCFVSCLLMLNSEKFGGNINRKDEESILLRGLDRKYTFPAIGVPKEIFKRFGKKINIIVDNKYFTNFLIKKIRDRKNFNVFHKKINPSLVRELLKNGPIACHIDDNLLGDYSHASHFIIIEKSTPGGFGIIDPWYGKRRIISEKTLTRAILSLKKHIKMCPLIYYF